MKESVVRSLEANESFRLILAAICGCLAITIGSLLRVPCYPVPFTCQTLAIFILALTYSPKEACAAAVCYLFCASLGLPVLDGRVNPFWMFGKCAGYLLAFPLAAYLIAALRQKISPAVALLCGNGLILFCGSLWLIPYLGCKMALIKGALVFMPSGIIKAALALALAKRRWI